jgi:hypothetical protein
VDLHATPGKGGLKGLRQGKDKEELAGLKPLKRGTPRNLMAWIGELGMP